MPSILITLYALTVSRFITHRPAQDIVAEAALAAADDLGKVTVPDDHFGPVGLLGRDQDNGVGSAQIGLNELYATLRLDNMIAGELHHQLLSALVADDLLRARRLEQNLALELHRAVNNGDESSADSTSIFHHVLKLLTQRSRRDGEEVLVKVRVTLGVYRSAAAACLTPAPRLGDKVESGNFVRDGFYRPGYPAPIPGSEPVRFSAVSDHPILINPVEFSQSAGDKLASAVMVEAVFRPSASLSSQSLYRRAACALVGHRRPVRLPSSFLLSFPSGLAPEFHSLFDVLSYRFWKKSGEWQQVVSGDVPGPGHLAHRIRRGLSEMTPDEALACTLYHWLHQLGTQVNPVNFVNALKRSWDTPDMMTMASEARRWQPVAAADFNTCLAADTGARAYAIFHQTGPGGAGQVALKNAFGCLNPNTQFPASALPLYTDQAGEINLAGQVGFDQDLVKRFLSELYQTNLAGIESGSIARSTLTATNEAERRLCRQELVNQEEKRSIGQLIARQERTGNRAANKRQLGLLESRFQYLKEEIREQERERSAYQTIRARALIVAANAEKAALESLRISSRLSELAALGLASSDRSNRFIIGKRYLFFSHPEPASASDIYGNNLTEVTGQHAVPDRSHHNQKTDGSSWLARDFVVASPLNRSSKTASDCAGVEPMVRPLYLLYHPLSLSDDPSPVGFTRSTQSPFVNLPLHPGDQIYYAHNALETGRNFKAAWSIIARDRCLTPGTVRGHSRWSRLSTGTSSGEALVAEFQVRSPTPLLPWLESGTYLVDPYTNEHVSQIPPIPANML